MKGVKIDFAAETAVRERMRIEVKEGRNGKDGQCRPTPALCRGAAVLQRALSAPYHAVVGVWNCLEQQRLGRIRVSAPKDLLRPNACFI